MLIDHSGPAMLLIQAGICLFGYLGLGCAIYFFLALFIFGQPGISHPFSIVVECVGAVEILWYLVWFLPYRSYLARPGLPLDPITREERRALFHKLIRLIPDSHLFMRKWFANAHLDEIYRDDIRDWLLWAMWNKWNRPEEVDDDVDDEKDDMLRRQNNKEQSEEVDQLIAEWEDLTGMKFRRGRGGAQAIRASLDPVAMRHASLFWYLTVGALDLFSTAWLMLFLGFRFYRQPRSAFFTNFPFRPMTLLSMNRSAAPDFSYFYRPAREADNNNKTGNKKKNKKRTVVFLHGIGMGMLPYLFWLSTLPQDTGVLIVEFMPVSGRICPKAVSQREFVSSMRSILGQQGLDNVVLVAHSYGTLMVRSLLDDPAASSAIHSVVLIDPASIMMHLPDLGYNIMRRKPTTAPELEMQWFAAADPRTAHTLTRRLHWQDCILWREQMLEKRTTVVVASRDCVTSPSAAASYVYYGHVDHVDDQGADKRAWRKTPETWTGRAELELFYLWDRDHGQALFVPAEIRRVNRIIETYCDTELDETGILTAGRQNVSAGVGNGENEKPSVITVEDGTGSAGRNNNDNNHHNDSESKGVVEQVSEKQRYTATTNSAAV